MSGKVLYFADVVHDYKKLIGLVPTMPKIEVSVSELNDLSTGYVTGFKDSEINPEGLVMFYKREGKMTVLVGQSAVAQAVNNGAAAVQGYLVSSVVLKKARIVTTPAAPAAETTGFYSVRNRWDGDRNNRNSKTRK